MSEDDEARGRQASINGFANEQIVCGFLMKKYGNVSKVDLPLSPYDIIMVGKQKDGSEDIIRIQVKTAKHAVSFVGGIRGGKDREYKSDVKAYIQSPKLSDCIVGVHCEGTDISLYFVPTFLIAELKTKSVSINRIKKLRNNYEILERCKDRDFVIKKAKEYGILPSSHNSTLF
jgi:hypothetical protein